MRLGEDPSTPHAYHIISLITRMDSRNVRVLHRFSIPSSLPAKGLECEERIKRGTRTLNRANSGNNQATGEVENEGR
jgi:hypothetical protein